jgi:transposase InsO family protein
VSGFRFVDDHQADYRVTDLCRVAGVKRSSFYAWKSRPASPRQLANEVLLVEIREIHETSRRTYGAPRVCGQLRRRGRHVGHNRVAKLMADNGLVGAHARRKFRKGRHPATVPAPDMLQRDFSAELPDRRWVADISEFACWDGKLYLAGIRDLCDRTLVGWSMGERQTTDLVVAALVMALGRRNPTVNTIHHADHGTQGELNRSSQHLSMMEVAGGATAAVGRQGASPSDAVAGAAGPGSSCGARVLASDRAGQEHRGRLRRCRRVDPRRLALVPSRWRHGASESCRTDRPLLVVR